MDIVIKKYFDTWRAKNELPPEIRGAVRGELFGDLGTLNKWRNWRTGLRYEDEKAGGVLSGALDDCVVYPVFDSEVAQTRGERSRRVEGKYYAALDYKTRGYPPKEGGHKFYQGQLDAYTLLLEENGYPTNHLAYLVYYFPKEVRENGLVNFNVEVKEVKTNSENAKKEFKRALEVLKSSMPLKHSECAFCSWGEGFLE